MPTDLPHRPERPRFRDLKQLRIAVVSFRLRLLGWRIEQAREGHDHVRLLRLTAAWGELHRRTVVRLGRDAPSGAGRTCDTFCERVRQTVPLIEREERRIAW